MFLELEYRNTGLDSLAHLEVVFGDAYRTARSAHYLSVCLWFSVLIFGGYAAFRAELYFVLCLLVTICGWTLIGSMPFSRTYWAAVEVEPSSQSETRIRLWVKEDGLHESMDGVESFAPWSSVKSFTEFRETLFIEFGANLWAIIPRNKVSGGPKAVDDLMAILRERGIAESPSRSVQ